MEIDQIQLYNISEPPLTSTTPDANQDVTSAPIVPGTSDNTSKFPYAVVMVGMLWLLLMMVYLFGRWRQRARSVYVIPRVFVLCSPRTVQYHYELILRVGLPSSDLNPEKHDIDITVYGQQKHEAVPMTRLNTRTLLDEPLITNLSIIAYRLAEMPPLTSLNLRHSGPFRAWIFAYDFTVIDLSTNREMYYPLNQYIGSLMRQVPLEENTTGNTVQYPIDDVPLPQWSVEDAILLIYSVVNYILLTMTLLPINCSYQLDIVSVFLNAFGAMALVFFLDWLLYYNLEWNQDRRDYFNDVSESSCNQSKVCQWICCCFNAGFFKILMALLATLMGAGCIYLTSALTDWRESLVWILANLNTGTLVFGIWNLGRQFELGETIVTLGLKMRGIETVAVGMRYSEIVSDMQTKSGSTSEDELSNISAHSRLNRAIGPRSSVKSFGFDPITGHPSRRETSRVHLGPRTFK